MNQGKQWPIQKYFYPINFSIVLNTSKYIYIYILYIYIYIICTYGDSMGFYRIFGCLYGRLSSKMEYNNSQSLLGGRWELTMMMGKNHFDWTRVRKNVGNSNYSGDFMAISNDIQQYYRWNMSLTVTMWRSQSFTIPKLTQVDRLHKPSKLGARLDAPSFSVTQQQTASGHGESQEKLGESWC